MATIALNSLPLVQQLFLGQHTSLYEAVLEVDEEPEAEEVQKLGARVELATMEHDIAAFGADYADVCIENLGGILSATDKLASVLEASCESTTDTEVVLSAREMVSRSLDWLGADSRRDPVVFRGTVLLHDLDFAVPLPPAVKAKKMQRAATKVRATLPTVRKLNAALRSALGELGVDTGAIGNVVAKASLLPRCPCTPR